MKFNFWPFTRRVKNEANLDVTNHVSLGYNPVAAMAPWVPLPSAKWQRPGLAVGLRAASSDRTVGGSIRTYPGGWLCLNGTWTCPQCSAKSTEDDFPKTHVCHPETSLFPPERPPTSVMDDILPIIAMGRIFGSREDHSPGPEGFPGFSGFGGGGSGGGGASGSYDPPVDPPSDNSPSCDPSPGDSSSTDTCSSDSSSSSSDS